MGEYSKNIYTKKGINVNNFSYYVIQEDGITILVFKGTSNAYDVLTDIDIRPFYDKSLNAYIHRGFRDAAELIIEDIKSKYHLDHTVYLTGHSLGGAIAQVIGMWLHEEGNNVQIYTFGSPKVTTKFLFNKPNHWRMVYRSDPIPFLPPLPYVHSGIVINIETLEWDENHDEGNLLQTDGLDHSIKDYLDVLYKHLDNGVKTWQKK